MLRAHYAGTGKPRVIALYAELTSLVKANESVTDHVITTETAAQQSLEAQEKPRLVVFL